MKKVLIATHGKLAEGIVSSAEIILGKQENVYFINAYVDEIPFNEKIEDFLEKNISDDDHLIILTDVFGGSVNQTSLRYISNEQVNIITGFNLPLLLEILMLSEADITTEKIKEIITNSKEQIIYVNEELLKINETDEFDL
ncbi:PTS N-acetylglucosamine transporter subunit IIBC [Bacillus sp. FJAT-50079]|uniref:PTS sugar transporter subunit IIA n=1 Tax=Bacillus sp. FJAT-50079 TaxID=2833577 RepID=UPI001BCA42FB|nr:PTS N-acetylglucosamine transporter subunit IIBC [Bacillus sp. FJAT-50079]MBS4206565.1 PTS N-acetylglucosamine transporter subunit IIBC [Bacillus sp. FJAT-50079]